MNDPVSLFVEIIKVLNEESCLHIETASLVESASDVLHLVTDTIGINSYLDDDEEIHFEEEHATLSKGTIPFGQNYQEIKEFAEEALDSEDEKIRTLFEKVRFLEESWDLDVSPCCGSVTIHVFQMAFGNSKSPFYEDPDKRETYDQTEGPMW
jgi:hypothetical protein